MLRTCVTIVALGFLSCTPPSPPRPACSLAQENCDCVDDRECGDPALFFCDTVNSVCRPTCRTTPECNTRPAEFAIPRCSGPLGCWCDLGTCVTAQCSDDSECGALSCRSGQCVAPPVVFGVVPQGESDFSLPPQCTGSRVVVRAELLDRQGAPLVPAVEASFTTSIQ